MSGSALTCRRDTWRRCIAETRKPGAQQTTWTNGMCTRFRGCARQRQRGMKRDDERVPRAAPAPADGADSLACCNGDGCILRAMGRGLLHGRRTHRLRQDSLGGNSRTTVFCNCSPSSTNVSETLNALYFGSRWEDVPGVPAVPRVPWRTHCNHGIIHTGPWRQYRAEGYGPSCPQTGAETQPR